MLIPYAFFSLLIVSYLIVTIFLKCKMPFWSKQPVFHFYNLLYWLRPPGLISVDMPLINKYTDFVHIKTYSLDELTTQKEVLISTLCNFIKNNYLPTKDKTAQYLPTKNNIIEYLNSANHKAYCTFYQQQKLLFTKNTPDMYIDDTIAVVTARPLYVRLTNAEFPTYYVDNLCVKSVYRKKNIAANMIQTHYYNLRKNNKKINTCLFKREGQLNAIVPLVAFNTYCISIVDNFQTTSLPPSISLIEIGIDQIHLFVDFVKTQMIKFRCVILPDVTSLANLIKTDNLRVYSLVEKGLVSAYYVFRLNELYYDGKKTTECISMISACDSDIFIQGFSLACLSLQKKQQFDLVLIEETAHGHIIMDKLLQVSKIKFVSPTAFFFYNYACRKIKKSDILIIY
jgi:hypothetical protein